ncbi:MAG: DUF2505 domain-containing protein [Nocardioidaceae bacterium]|nr:DUF2505 domain-containing protein [Nocardioidaceae bacterium]
MTTRLTHDLTYDAPLADVAAMLADPAFREEVCDSLGVLRRQVRVEGSGAGMRVSIDQTQAAKGIPAVAAKIVGDEVEYAQVERWTTLQHADLTMAIPGKPGDISGTIDLTEAGGTTTDSIAMDIKVGIPFVGGKIEGLIADMLRAALEVENKVGRAYLSR